LLRRLRQGDLLAAVFLLALVTCFLGRVTLGGKVLLPLDNLFSSPPWNVYAAQFGISVPHNELIGDMILQNYSWKSFAKESYLNGVLPLWNPYIFCGMPFLAAGQYAALYPLGAIFYVLPVAQAYGWFTLVHLFLGGLFMYLYVKLIGGGRWGALVSAITFMFCGFLVVSFLWPMIVSTVIWLPLLLAIIEVIVRRFERAESGESGLLSSCALWVPLGGVAVGLQFLAGHLEMSFYLLFTMMVYAAFRLLVMVWRRQAKGRILGAGLALLIMVALGFGLAAAQLLPFYELIKENYRSGLVSYREVIGWALPKMQFLSFLMPDFFGNPTHHSYFDVIQWKDVAVSGAADFAGNPRSYPFWGAKNYVEGAAYIGILPLLLAGVALLLRRNKYTLFFVFYAVFSLLLAFGSPLYKAFFYGIPGFDQLHTPFRWVIPYSFSVAVLAGLGMSALIDRREGKASELGAKVATFLGRAAPLLGAVLLVVLGVSRLFSDASLGFANRLLQRSHTLPFAFESGQMLYSYQFRNIAIFALLLLAGGVIVAYGLREKGGNRFLPVVAVGLVSLDLFFFGYNFNSATEPDLLKFTPPSIDFLKSDPDLYRVTSFNYDDTLKPNTAMLSRTQDVRGYDTIILERYVRFWRLLEEPSGLLYSQINKLVKTSSLESPLLDLMNVKYVLTTQNIGLPNYTEVYRGEINIYRNDNVLPRAFVVFDEIQARDGEEALEALGNPAFDPQRTVVLEEVAEALPLLPSSGAQPLQAAIVDYQPNQVTVRVSMPHEGYLILTDSYFPGWRAHSGDEELPILRADYIFRAVQLPQGERTVVFKYSPDSFKLGLYVGLMSGILVLLGLGYWVWRRFYGETAETSTVRRIAKNSLTPMATQVLNKVVDAAFAIFLLRFLGPSNFGNYAFAVVFIGYFSLFTDFGLGTLLTREVARDKAQANRYLSNSIMVRLGLSLASTPLLIGLVMLYRWKFGLASDASVAILLFAVSLIPSAFASALSSVFIAHERMEYPAAVTVITTLVKASLGIIVLLAGWGIVGLAGVSIFASTVTAIVLYMMVAKTFFKPTPDMDFSFQKGMIATSAPLMINNFLSTIFFRVDMMLLQPIKGSRSVGYYGTAYKFIDALNIIPSFFTLAIFPVMSRYAESARDTLARAYCLSLKALLIVSLPITVGTTLIAGKLIPLLFGSEYAPSIVALQILIWFLPFSYVNSVTQYVIIALNRQRFLTFAFLIGASFNLLTNLAVIPYWGINGAAVVTIISEIILLIPFLYVVMKELGRIPLLQLAWRPTLAALVMGAVLFPLRQLNLLIIIILGAVIYLAVLVALRTFDEQDMAIMRALRAR